MMDTFPPIPRAIWHPRRRWPNDPEFKREPRGYLDAIMHVSLGHRRPYTWGFTIYRTVYTPESDVAFPKVLGRLREYIERIVYADIKMWRKKHPCEDPLDPIPNDELMKRYQNDIIEDPATLDGASIEEIGERFDKWVAEHKDPGRRGQCNTRFQACLVIDQEVLQDISRIPEDPFNYEKTKWYRCVKVVSSIQRPPEKGGRYWFRVAVPKLINFWFMATDIPIDEFGEPDPRDGVVSWVGRLS
ncbi:Fc.00g050040.m01.CDS01 [Cosmosporella sp. VM-42]